MTNETAPTPDDPRFALASVAQSVGELITAIEAMPTATLAATTPCPDYSVADLLDHVVLVARRVAVIGNGGHFSQVQQTQIGSGWAKEFQTSCHDIMEAWTDPAKLGQIFEVPWGPTPGAAALLAYVAEFAVHGWDLGQATDQPFAIDDAVLRDALTGVKFIPAEGRHSDEIPFGPVVDPGPDASALEQMAGWLGRPVG